MARSTAQRVSASLEHRARTKEFLTFVNAIAGREGWSEYEVFTKWLEAASCALKNPILRLLRDDKGWDQNEQRYMEIVRSCRHPAETMRDMSNMLGVITLALREKPTDFIGPVFMEVAANSHVGQFFTPNSLSEALAGLTLQNARERLYEAYINEGRTVLALLEPACGVGGIVLAANQVLREQGFDLENEIHWTCIDIDWRALCGAFIQLELTGTPATLVEGNSITMEYAAAWPTSALILQRRNQLHSDGLGVEYSYTQEGRIPA